MALIIGLAVLILLVLVGRGVVSTDPKALAALGRKAGGVALLGVAGWLTLTGRWEAGLPLGAFGLSLLGYGNVFGGGAGWRNPFGGLAGGAGRSPGLGSNASKVETAALTMELDHASGRIAGAVRSGPFTGRALESLTMADLRRLWAMLAGDAESRALLEAYLDRRQAGWRQDFDMDARAGQGGAAAARRMSVEEAYETLGLRPGATEDDIRAAHRTLMKRVHPDVGGTAALAARLNEARDRLLP
ncbi:DnaJ domain-containing protein [Pseudoxanthobacter sp.]|uniref:DnaJ domain-containing protein n=1 Tax=Pseudoxanthobacter sp. TaxID=1925742 RepID=UPI002FE09D55